MTRSLLIAPVVAMLLFGVFFLQPIQCEAAGLVPCTGVPGDECQFCQVAALIHNVFEWLTKVLGIIAMILIVVVGLLLVTTLGSVAAKTKAKKMILTIIVAYIFLFGAAIIVDFFMKVLLTDQNYGVWDEIQCVKQPQAQDSGRLTASGDNAQVLGASDIDARVAAIAASGDVQAQVSAAAEQAGLSEEETKLFRALVSQESSNCSSKVGPETKYGRAYGCGQLLLSTAQDLDPEATEDKLVNDDAYNLALSAQYFKSRLGNANDPVDALATYNGGTKALEPSRDCPGAKRWECPFDSGGCWDIATQQPNSNTSCTPNAGFDSYEQTRHYVENITRIAEKL